MSQPIKLTLRQINAKEGMVILHSAQGQADHQFTLPWLDDREWNAVFLYLKAFRPYRETWPKGAVVETAAKLRLAAKDGTPSRQRVERIGRLLYQAVFGEGKCERLFQRAFHSYQGNPPLIELHFPDAGSYLQTYPWEVLHDGDEFLFDSLRASLVRYVDFGQPLTPLMLKDRLNLLLVDPRPNMPQVYPDLPVLDRTTLKNLLAEASSQIQVRDLDSASAPASTFAQLAQALNQFYRNIHVVHLDAHGEYGVLCDECTQLSSAGAKTCQHCGWTFPPEQKAQGYVAFAQTDDNLEWVSGPKLGKALLNRDIQLVVLSVCDSGLTGGSSAFNSVAGALVKQGIPAVVAMQFPVEVNSTRAFVASFYQTLLNNAPLTQAVAAAKTSLLDIEDAWYRPVLYLRTDPANIEGRIFEAEITYPTSTPDPSPPIHMDLPAPYHRPNEISDDRGNKLISKITLSAPSSSQEPKRKSRKRSYLIADNLPNIKISFDFLLEETEGEQDWGGIRLRGGEAEGTGYLLIVRRDGRVEIVSPEGILAQYMFPHTSEKIHFEITLVNTQISVKLNGAEILRSNTASRYLDIGGVSLVVRRATATFSNIQIEPIHFDTKKPQVSGLSPTPEVSGQPNTSKLRRQLNQVFDDAELDAFCMDNFPQVYDKFSRGMRKDEKITLLLDYCRRVPECYQRLLIVLEEQRK